jgi:hypothetical protein
VHGERDAAVTDGWLKSRLGKALRATWGLLTDEERALHLLAVEDGSFPLEENSTGILDDRRDPSCYPKRTRGAECPAACKSINIAIDRPAASDR